jgi:hypothetical protein
MKKAFNPAERRRNRLPPHQGKSISCEMRWGRHSACRGLFQQPAKAAEPDRYSRPPRRGQSPYRDGRRRGRIGYGRQLAAAGQSTHRVVPIHAALRACIARSISWTVFIPHDIVKPLGSTGLQLMTTFLGIVNLLCHNKLPQFAQLPPIRLSALV